MRAPEQTDIHKCAWMLMLTASGRDRYGRCSWMEDVERRKKIEKREIAGE